LRVLNAIDKIETVDIKALSRKLGLASEQVNESLERLEKLGGESFLAMAKKTIGKAKKR
jgi:hypothetical protein